MIQTLGDILLLTAIVAIGVVSFLLAVLLYHLIFVVMDLRQVMKRLNEFTAEVEAVLTKPLELVAEIVQWVQEKVWNAYFATPARERRREKRAKRKKRRKGRGGFEQAEV